MTRGCPSPVKGDRLRTCWRRACEGSNPFPRMLMAVSQIPQSVDATDRGCVANPFPRMLIASQIPPYRK